MPVRVRAIPPGEFIRNHLRDVGGVDYVQSVHKAYKAHLRSVGLNGISRETTGKYFWLAFKMGLIVFDHAEPSAYWNAQVDGVHVPKTYKRPSRPFAPSPRHYYRLIDENDPRWIRLEASYRESIGIPVPPPFPRVPWAPMPVEYPIPPEEMLPAAPPPAVPAPPKPKKVKKPKAVKVKKPTPAETASELAAPFEARIAKVVEAIDQLGRTPTTQLADAIEEEVIGIGEDVIEAVEGKRGVVRDRLIGINSILSRTLDDYPLVKSSLRNMLRETLPARRVSAEGSFQAALRVVREDLTGEV